MSPSSRHLGLYARIENMHAMIAEHSPMTRAPRHAIVRMRYEASMQLASKMYAASFPRRANRGSRIVDAGGDIRKITARRSLPWPRDKVVRCRLLFVYWSIADAQRTFWEVRYWTQVERAAEFNALPHSFRRRT